MLGRALACLYASSAVVSRVRAAALPPLSKLPRLPLPSTSTHKAALPLSSSCGSGVAICAFISQHRMFASDLDFSMFGQSAVKPRMEQKNPMQTLFDTPVKRDAATLPPLQRNTWGAHAKPPRTQEEINNFRKTHNIRVNSSGTDSGPVFSFDEIPLPVFLSKHLASFSKPTPIQAEGIPLVMQGLDMVGRAETGSGKTLAYLIPAIAHITAQRQVLKDPSTRPAVLVLAPTRELAVQIESVVQNVFESSRFHSACLYGGGARSQQLSRLSMDPVLVVGTPGRLSDLVNSGQLTLQYVSLLVVDEADRMLDMGFEPQLREIAGYTRPDRQTIMWSATWPKEVKALARDFMNPSHSEVLIGDVDQTVNRKIRQSFEFVEQTNALATREKLHLLVNHLKNKAGKVLVFCERKTSVDQLEAFLNTNLPRLGLKRPVVALHGDKAQTRRDIAISTFRENSSSILVATDVAARGLDIPDVEMVVNFELPRSIDSYIHRIGRTGRAGKSGEAVAFFSHAEDRFMAPPLVNTLREAGQTVPPQLASLANQIGHRSPPPRSNSRSNNNNNNNNNNNSGRFGSFGRSQSGDGYKYNNNNNNNNSMSKFNSGGNNSGARPSLFKPRDKDQDQLPPSSQGSMHSLLNALSNPPAGGSNAGASSIFGSSSSTPSRSLSSDPSDKRKAATEELFSTLFKKK